MIITAARSVVACVLFALCGCGSNTPEFERDPDRTKRVLAMADASDGKPTFQSSFVAADPYQSIAGSMENQAQFDPSDSYQGLPQTGSYGLVQAYCSGCHSLQIVMQQRASRDKWSQTLEWMSAKQGMPKLPESDEKEVLDYLTEHFGS